MTAQRGLRSRRSRPLVVTISDIPIFCAAIAGTLGEQASVRSLKPVGRDTEVVLSALDPDTVIVDSPRGVRAAKETALRRQIRLIHVASNGSMLRILGAGGWREHPLPSMTTDALQGLLLATALGGD